jgi:ABC-type glycerol-3-phosphate transport system substrate-binding protein
MRFHKILCFFIFSLIVSGCGIKIGTQTDLATEVTQVEEELVEPVEPTLLIWSYTDEFLTELDAFEREQSCKIEFELIEINNFEKMVATRIDEGEKPDIIISDYESIMGDTLEKYILPLNDFSRGYQIDRYLNENMLARSYDKTGKMRGLSYHMTPIAVFYRRSLARQVLGSDDPQEIAKYYTTVDAIYELGLRLKEHEIELVPDPYALRHFAPPASVEENHMEVDLDQWRNYLTTVNNIKRNKLTPFYVEWSKDWFGGMRENVFSYILPNWGLSQILFMSAEETSGDWAIVRGPYSREWGGTWLSMTQVGQENQLAEKFFEYVLLDEDHQKNWIGDSYHISSHNLVQQSQTYTDGNSFLGGQDYHQTFKYIIDSGLEQSTKDRFLEDITIRYINDEFHTIDEVIDVLDESS